MCALFTGITLIIVNELINKPEKIVTYKYLPRDLDTYLREEPYASVTFADMFTDEFEPSTMYSSTLASNTASASKVTFAGFTKPARFTSNATSAVPMTLTTSTAVVSPHLATSSVVF